MANDSADSDAQDVDAKDNGETEDTSEQDQKFGREAEDVRKHADEHDDKIETPEGEYPSDAKGFDGSSLEEILKDREERLDPDNRPENTEVSNAGREFDGEKGMFTDEEGYDEAEKKFTLDDT
jgi:hypothetical protein